MGVEVTGTKSARQDRPGDGPARGGAMEAGTLEVPPPPARVAEWPIVGDRVHAFWAAASRNLDTALDPWCREACDAAGGPRLAPLDHLGFGNDPHCEDLLTNLR